MATQTPEAAPLVVLGSRRAKPAFASAGYRQHVSRALTAAAAIVAAGTFLSVVVLWGLERQSIPGWRFTALANTAQALPWVVLAIALFYAALHAGESTSLLAYRLLGLGLILLALIGGGLGGLMLAQYGALPQDIDAQTALLWQATLVKAIGICALHVVILAPVGVFGLRRPIVG